MDECQDLVLQHAADSIQMHTNSCHRAQLRKLAAWVGGVPVDSIASAELVFVCMHGFQISWLDVVGGHVVPISFEHPANDSAELSTLLGSYLLD